MDTQSYIIAAMIGRYILIVLCFLIFIQVILEIRKASQYNKSGDLASLEWKKERTIFTLQQENIIGRGHMCDIQVKSLSVSRRCFKLYLDSDEWIIVPIKKSEVYINDYLIEDKAQVSDGDKISFGKVNMIFHINSSEEELIDE